MKNDYEIRGETTVIFLKKRDGTSIECLVDTEMIGKIAEFEGSWYPTFSKSTRSYYARGHIQGGNRSQRGRSFGMHRFIMDTPKGLVVDHIDGNTLDNRKSNLQNCTQLVNINNSNNKLRKRKNPDGTIGIHWNKGRKKWRLYFRLREKQEHFGYFKEYEDAIKEKNRLLTQKSS